MAITASVLRQDVYRILDEIIATGEPVEIRRKGKILRIVPETPPGSRLARITKLPDLMVGDPEEYVHVDWSDEWKP